ncbi:MAG: FTR1 family iron permease [Gemmatimonadota bacterium]
MRSALRVAVLLLGLLIPQTRIFSQQPATVYTWLDDVAAGMQQARSLAQQGAVDAAHAMILRTYLDRFESLEGYYGPNAKYGVAGVAEAVYAGEAAFHQLLRSRDAASIAANASAVEQQLETIRAQVRASGVQTIADSDIGQVAAREVVAEEAAATAEIRAILKPLSEAATAYSTRDAMLALRLVERAYLEGFEPLESRLPSDIVGRIEKAIHLQLRPAIRAQADVATVTSVIGAIGADLLEADRFLSGGGSAGFAAVNSFAIIVREGLEAVLLIAALLAYLTAIGAQTKQRRQLWTGVVAGVVASIGTWFVAATLVPISGANRELLEGVTALVAVGVLLYVANWLFQKTYIHDWKDYLRERVGSAMTRGSAFAMAALAFAAVYREGFETVLFYQALAFDAGFGPILAGFIPGLLLILVIGFAIIRLNARLPLKTVFGWTNAVLMYLAFVFLGKGLYNLQEGGLFSPHPLPLPDHPALRQLLGFYPVAETIIAQSAFLLLIAGTYTAYRLRKRDRVRVASIGAGIGA